MTVSLLCIFSNIMFPKLFFQIVVTFLLNTFWSLSPTFMIMLKIFYSFLKLPFFLPSFTIISDLNSSSFLAFHAHTILQSILSFVVKVSSNIVVWKWNVPTTGSCIQSLGPELGTLFLKTVKTLGGRASQESEAHWEGLEGFVVSWEGLEGFVASCSFHESFPSKVKDILTSCEIKSSSPPLSCFLSGIDQWNKNHS